MIQYYIVAIIVSVIVIGQFISYFKNKAMINRLKTLFPDVESLSLNEAENSINSTTLNSEFRETFEDINGYLQQNKNKAADYSIIKEIVERDSQRIEEDVDTMLSTPLYLGLMATILGAAIGVVFFAWTDLEALLTGTQVQTEGIKTLLTDIGVAMIASFLGVLFTAKSTSNYKDSRGEMLKKKNKFLSWIQTRVMPNMSDDLSGALTKMAQDLNHFNGTFAENTRELKETLSQVTNNYDNQVQLLEAIDKIKIAKIAKANVEVYDKLQGCTDELERLFEHLGKSEEYISQVVSLNSKLGDIEERTRLSEELGNYFKNEIEFVQDRQGMMRQQMSGLDVVMQDALENLGSSLATNIAGLTEVFQRQNQQVQSLIEEQQNSLSQALEEQRATINNKIAEINDPFGGLKETFKEVGEQSRQGIESISSIFENQNSAIAEMLATQKQILETEIANQREVFKDQLANVPTQMNELARVLDKLNNTIESQQQKIDFQGEAINALAAKMGASSVIKNNSKRGILNYLIPLGVVGSFVLLLALLLVQLFGFTL